MNKNLHRIVFNAKRGLRMVVQETATSAGKANGATRGPHAPGPAQPMGAGNARLAQLALAVLCLLGAPLVLAPAAQAQIVADPTAPGNQRPTVLAAPNGVPLVNIQTPSAAGVSRNTYSQFDVNAPGAILNNARSNAATQLGGWVQGNPWLATGSARVILNEVNSSNPSQLRGFVEVAGQRADVIIANPAGVNIDGAGFVNASRATVTTGTASVLGGALDSFVVQRGLVSINGAGLDARQTDYTSILARAVEVNGQIQANELKVITGANQIDAAQTSAAPVTSSGAAPAFALDASALGGMYAGKITLIGTEAGLGVRNSGVIGASAGDLVVQTNGWLSNSAIIQASGNAQIDSASSISNSDSGSIYASGNTRLSAGASITNAGLVAAQGNTSLQASGAGAQISASKGSVIAAGLNADGTLATAGNLSVASSGTASLHGQSVAGSHVGISGTQLSVADGQLSGQAITLAASTGHVDASRAGLSTPGALAISAAQTLRTDGATVSANQLVWDAHDLSNLGGEIVQAGTGDTRLAVTGTIDNTSGRIAVNSQNLTLAASTLTNTDGRIEHAGTGTSRITSTGALDNSDGKIVSNGAATVTAQSLNNQGGQLQTAGASALAVSTTGLLDNSAGGQMRSGGSAVIDAGTLNNTQGQVMAGAGLRATSTGAITNTQGLIAANGAVTVTAASLDNSRGTVASVQGSVLVTTTGTTTNDSGRIEALGSTVLVNAGLRNTQAAGQATGGSITGNTISIQTNGQALHNGQGTIAAVQDATFQTGALNNDEGLIQSADTLHINTHGQALSNANAAGYSGGAGGISSQAGMTLETGTLDNAAGFIGAKGALVANSAHISNTAGGQIVGESTLDMTATGFDNQGGQVQALGDVTLDVSLAAGTGTVNNSASLIRSAGTVRVTAAAVINSGTLGASATEQGIEGHNVAITAGAIANDTGAIRAGHDATLRSSASINNSAGLISAGHALTLQDSASAPAGGTLAISNSAGTLIADQLVALTAASLGGDGKILSKGDLSIALSSDFSNSGEVIANHNASIVTSGELRNSGRLNAGSTLTVSASHIDNAATGEIAGALTHITASGTLTNRGLIDGQDTQLNATTLNNLGTGRIYGDTLSIAAATVNNDAQTVNGVTTAGTIAARQRLDIGAAALNNSNGALIFSAGDMAIGASLDAARRATGQAGSVNNASATIEALGNLRITTGQLNNINNHFSYTTRIESIQDGIREDASPTQYRVFTRTISIPVATSSDPANLRAGGDLSITSAQINNDMSHIIAAGVLSAQGGGILNNQVYGARTVHDVGTTYSLVHIPQSGICNFLFTWNCVRAHDEWWPSVYDSTSTSTVAVAQITVAQGSDLTLDARSSNTAVSQSTSAASAATASARSAGITQVTASVGGADPVTGRTPVIRTTLPNTTVPTASLFRATPSPSASYLIETDPRFASYRQWLSSDYLLRALGLDPALTQKRLGDGFYEQRLVNEQIAQLTGQRFLDGYSREETQYQALMDAGVTFAQQYNLRPGIALSAAQMAQLSSDIVWLVERDVSLPGGDSTKALVPQVYARVQPGDLMGTGSLLAGREVNLQLGGDMTNSGTVAGRSVVSLNAQNVHNLGGRITGNTVQLNARSELNNIGGQIDAASRLNVAAARDLNVVTTTTSASNQTGGISSASSNTFSMTGIDRVAGLYITNPGGTLVASAGRDAKLIAGVISNTGSAGTTVIAAGRDLNLGTVTEASSNAIIWNATNYRKDSQSREVGSNIQTAGNLQLGAGNNLSARAAQVNSSEGALTLSAGNSVLIGAGESRQSLDEGHQHTSKGFLSKKTRTTRETMDRTDALASSLSGNSVTVLAGQDLTLKGSSAVSDRGTTLVAGNNLSIEAAQNTYASSSFKDDKKSGLFGTSGLSVTLGSQQQSSDTKTSQTTAAASTVGSLGGNVTLQAGNGYRQVGSDVMAPGGDIAISAQTVNIQEARETSQSQTEQKSRQTGLTLAITSPVISAVQTAQGMAQAAGNTSSSRMQALAAATTALNGYNTYQGLTDKAGNFSADKAAEISLNLSLGSSKSQSTSASQSDSARSSTVSAGRNLTIIASGAGQDRNLTVQGSSISAGNNATLIADNQIKLQAAQNTASQTGTNSSRSGAIGASLGSSSGLTFNASASKGQGSGNGQDTSSTNSQVSAGNTVTLLSGGDTTLKGAVVTANTVQATVGGNLNMASPQDSSTYTSRQSSAGGSISVSAAGIPTGGGISASRSNINSRFTSVNEQTAIKAGDGGFQVDMKGNTDLKGAVIASTQAAVDNKQNSFATGGVLTLSDLQNSASYNANAAGISVSVGQQDGKYGVNGVGAGIGSDKGQASSTTTAGISGLAGNAAVRTGDAETGLKPIFDAAKVQREIDAQVTITQAFSKEAPKAVATFSANQIADLKKDLAQETDPSQRTAINREIDKWSEGGRYRIALHTATGALSGGLSGTAGAAASASAANLMNDLQDSLAQGLQTAGLGDTAAKAIAQGVASLTAAGMGAAVGGGQGAATALTVDANNRQLHPTEVQRAKELAANSKGKYTKEQIEEQMRLMGNVMFGVGPNSPEVLTTGQAIASNSVADPGMPKVTDGKVVVEVPGQANAGIQQFIIANTKDGAGYIPGASPYAASNASLNAPTFTNTPLAARTQTANCANSDLACRSGVGVQQSSIPQMTQAAREAIADGASRTSRQAGVVGAAATAATAVASPQLKPITGAVAVGATVIGVAADTVDYAMRPNPKQFIKEQLGVGLPAAVLSERYPLWAPVINEVSEQLKKEVIK